MTLEQEVNGGVGHDCVKAGSIYVNSVLPNFAVN